MKKHAAVSSLALHFRPGIKNAVRWITDPGYRYQLRELLRLKSLPRYRATSTRLLGPPLQIIDAASFLSAYYQIFDQDIYRFSSGSDVPRILDGGANIGLSTIYFKRLFPRSRITAFEPDVEIFEVLRSNVESFGYDDVELIPKALWSSSTRLEFKPDGADGGRIVRGGDAGAAQTVPAVGLRDDLDDRVDFLKLDVEGAETEVLQGCADLLCHVRHLFVEYHSFVDEPQSLASLLQTLAESGFRVHIHSANESPTPFLGVETMLGMDLLLNIFAYRG